MYLSDSSINVQLIPAMFAEVCVKGFWQQKWPSRSFKVTANCLGDSQCCHNSASTIGNFISFYEPLTVPWANGNFTDWQSDMNKCRWRRAWTNALHTQRQH